MFLTHIARSCAFALAGVGIAACASVPPVAGEACGAAQTVLAPVINAVIEEGGIVEIETRTALVPPVSRSDRWALIQEFGFSPVWRSAGTDDALRRAYWQAWRDTDQSLRINDPDRADRQAWEAAYDAIGDDCIFPDDGLWRAFFDRNRADADFTCAADIAAMTGARLVGAGAPRGAGAMRLTPAAPGMEGGRALMAARTVYPPLEPGAAPRETGTIWLLRVTEAGDWRVLSARRMEAME
ncbi:MAG: hypothetical protein NXI12_07065 [Alphaproteobacteria bacterium]|nr:hypothetical protein [Alphaproteobacteria bacterium]